MRPKDSQDNATPSENSLAANGLLRLAALTRRRQLRRGRGPLHPQPRARDRRAPHRVRVPARRARTRSSHPRSRSRSSATPPIPRPGALRAEVVTRLIPASVTVTAAPDGRRHYGAAVSPLLAGRDRGRRESRRVRVRATTRAGRRSRRPRRCATRSTPRSRHAADTAAHAPRRRRQDERAGQARGLPKPSASASAIAQP